MEKAIIVAYDKNRAIGQNGDMPWGRSLPADLVGKPLSQLARDHFQTEKILSFHPSQLVSKKFLRL